MKRLLPFLILASSAAAENLCVTCHEAEQKTLSDSAHLVFSCADCHNGKEDAATADEAHAPAFRFVGRPPAAELHRMCADCHDEEAKDFERSAHFAGLGRGDAGSTTCVSCHTRAGAATAHAIAASSEEGAPSARAAIAATCARCHASAATMARSGLRLDQLPQYRESVHGRLVLEQGDLDAATCADCHHPHRALPARDPASETHPRNQAKTCGGCHGSAKLMAPRGRRVDVVARWEASPHARNLESGAPSCAGCHGAHGARVPPPAELRGTCGRCHEGPARALAAGAHAAARVPDPADPAGAPVHCAHCHDAHGTPKPEAPFGATTCSRCHERGSAEVAGGDALSTLAGAFHADLVALHGQLETARRRGHDVPACREALSGLEGRAREFGSLVHGARVEPCAREREAFVKEAAALRAQLDELTPGRRPIGWLPAFWVFLFVGVGLLYAKHRSRG